MNSQVVPIFLTTPSSASSPRDVDLPNFPTQQLVRTDCRIVPSTRNFDVAYLIIAEDIAPKQIWYSYTYTIEGWRYM